ncbi:hypothetical protein [Paenibacillus ginsengarvi]|uniref:Uncharacterized protein n=1 Tax=Paenibacillus ginsengarvi TaxID=400777 RepID=A0A3B0CM51_9BACL|nr:hypothetical protein [Paenibacillus ginsengarvi]RKN86755.1 hypothetical protein D7M11_02010 [Paenibacillus ginsengarvi]
MLFNSPQPHTPVFLNSLPYKRNELNQSKHDRIIQKIADDFARQGFIVYADHIKWSMGRPPLFNGHRPDLTIQGQNGRVIVEVETFDSCLESHAISQLRAFNRVGIPVIVVIPEVIHTILGANNGLTKFNALNNRINTSKLYNVKVDTIKI